MDGDSGPVMGEDGLAEGLDFAEPDGLESDGLESEGEPADA